MENDGRASEEGRMLAMAACAGLAATVKAIGPALGHPDLATRVQGVMLDQVQRLATSDSERVEALIKAWFGLTEPASGG